MGPLNALIALGAVFLIALAVRSVVMSFKSGGCAGCSGCSVDEKKEEGGCGCGCSGEHREQR